jgi:hypothetical protein
MNKPLQQALNYAELNYPVFPCAPGRKHPLTPHGFHDATTVAERIEAWWTQNPNANVAIPTTGLVVIDVDGPANSWLAALGDRGRDLMAGPVASTPGGGRHYIFRAPHNVRIRSRAGHIAPRVDVRAEGGYILVPPSLVGGKPYKFVPGLELEQPRERLPEPPDWLLPQLVEDAPSPPTAPRAATGRDDSNKIPSGQRNATLARLGGGMRRQGMSRDEILAALVRANADRCIPSLPAAEVERIATNVARYEPDQISVALVEDHYAQDFATPATPAEQAAAGSLDDPGPLPMELMRVPGFVSEVMDHCMETAPYPNQSLAFCGALALQACLAGRKVRDQADNRTNLYLLGLAFSSVGKDWPRKLNTKVLHQVGMAGCLGDHFASGEGIQDGLFGSPCMLFQTDEIDGLLQTINKSKDARYESVMSTLLTMYSSANSIFPMRRRAGRESPGAIDQPCLIVYGTAIPTHYYGALSERMLTNGFVARMLVVESGRRSTGQEPKILDIPPRVLETAAWWANFRPGAGNLEAWHPVPAIVEYTEDARRVFVAGRLECEAEYSRAEQQGDAVGTTVWGRANEHSRKLALLHAISVDHRKPRIDADAARWGTRFVTHQTRRLLFMAQNHVADNPFHAECLKLIRKLRDAPGGRLPHSVLLKRMKIDARIFQDLINTLEQQGDIATVMQATTGRPQREYQLRVEMEVKQEGETAAPE